MATEKSFQLYINEDNVKQYFSASGGALNGAGIGGKYITMRTSSTTATFTMRDAGRDVLFPSAAAVAHKVDVWVQTIATLNSSKNTINVAIAGQNAVATEKISTSLTEHTGSVSGSFTKSSTSAIYTIKILNGFHAAGVRDTSITAYFNQYSCEAKTVGKGIKNVSVSSSAPYEGEIVTFSAELYSGAEFNGWYSDKACTQLVSGSLTYSTSAADLVLYAKGSLDLEIYNCTAIAGENITSTAVSESSVVSGENVTFSAVLNEGCLFDGWYSDSSYTNLVSTENPYTTAITTNTTLYAKAHKKQFTMTVGTAEHGVASVSSSVVSYEDTVSFSFTPEDETWELYGWYSDVEFANLVSEENPYSFVATKNVTLYPKTGIKRYKIILTTTGSIVQYSATKISIISTITSALTKEDIYNLRAGNFSKIPNEKIFTTDTQSGNAVSSFSASIMAPLNSTVALFAEYQRALDPDSTVYFTKNNSQITNGPHFIFTATENVEYKTSRPVYRCDCSALASDGIERAEVYPKAVQQGSTTTFSAEVLSGYSFQGWYSDGACTALVSSNNPYKATAPKYTDTSSATSLILYAKAKKLSNTGFYLKKSGAYVEADAIYQKTVNGWTQITDYTSLFPYGYYLPSS